MKKGYEIGRFILGGPEGKTPIPCSDLFGWALWLEKNGDNRLVARTEGLGLAISTVFLGLDHGYGGEPLLFETMVFRGDEVLDMERCATWDEAEKMHRRMTGKYIFRRASPPATRDAEA